MGAVRRLNLASAIPWLVGGVVVVGVPMTTNEFVTLEWALVWMYVIAIIGLNLLTGFSGQFSLGNGAFMAVGGYTTAIVGHRTGLSYLATIPLAALTAGVAGFLFGVPALRLKGLYLALATFGLAVATPSVIKNYGDLTGGHEGINLPLASAPFGLDSALSSEQWLYFLSLTLAGALMLFAVKVVGSHTGRALMAIRDNEIAAAASGINLSIYKTLAFALSAAYAGVAGSLVATATAYVNPDTFGFGVSVALLVGAVVGGLGTRWGPVLGAVFVVWLPTLAQRIGSVRPDIAYGVILVLVMFVMPGGVAGLLALAVSRYRRRRQAARLQDERGLAGETASPATSLPENGEPVRGQQAGRGG